MSVRDDEHVFDAKLGGDPDRQDSYFVFLDPLHRADADGGELAVAAGIGFDAESGEIVRAGYGLDVGEEALQVAVTRAPGLTIYECRIALGSAFLPGKSYGFDHYLSDLDAGDEDALGVMFGNRPSNVRSRDGRRT